MSRLTTTMNKQLQVVAKGQPAPALGQQGVPTAQVIVPPLLLPLGAPIQWGLATADPNPAPFPKTLSGRLTNRKRKGKSFLVPFRPKHKSFLVSFRVNLNRKRKDKSFLSFRR